MQCIKKELCNSGNYSKPGKVVSKTNPYKKIRKNSNSRISYLSYMGKKNFLNHYIGKEGYLLYIYRASMVKNGVKIYAKDYGHKAFKIWIGSPKKKKRK